MSGRLDASAYAARIGETFRLTFQDGTTLGIVLFEVQDLGTRSTPAGPLSTYSLRFRSPGEKRFAAQGTYRVEHDELDAQDIFLVPLGPDSVGMRYVAVFN
jgi:hypothetical protein